MGENRYVDDVPYEHAFIPELSPAWIDFAAVLWGWAPPDRSRSFAWCDMGCGQGVNAAFLAATHPNGQFHGIDSMPMHAAHGQRLAGAVGAGNVAFHAVDFGAARDLDLPAFDYITAHGVYSWVDDRARDDLRAFIDRRLKPGGLVYVSYNALPGRSADLPFQQLMLQLAGGQSGDSIARVSAAAAVGARMRKLNTAALMASPMAGMLLGPGAPRRKRYLAHELMNPNWRPLSGVQMRRAMAEIGLTPAGSATLVDNFDSYVLCGAARKLLETVPDPDLRDLVRDYLINQSFRRDVFVRDGTPLDDDAQARRLRETTFALSRPPGQVSYRLETTAGELTFDNPAARSIVRALAHGARTLSAIAGDPDDLIANAMILAASRQIWPVEPGNADVSRFNQVVAERWGGPEPLGLVGLGCGAALLPPAKVVDALRQGNVRGAAGAWRKHLAAYGAQLG